MKNSFLFLLSTVLLGSAVFSRSMWAQQATASEGVPAHIVVTVEPKHGSNAAVVHKEDVMVYEGRDRDAVTDWIPLQGDRAGLELVLLIDDDSGLNLGSQLESIKQFMNAQPASTKIGVAYMQNGVARIVQNLTNDHAQAAKALRLPMGVAGVNASPYFALSDLVKQWPASTERREVLMITDGIDRYYGSGNLDDPYLQAAVDDAGKAGIVVSAIYTPGAGHFAHSYWQNYWGTNLFVGTGRKDRRRGVLHRLHRSARFFRSVSGRPGHADLQHQYFLSLSAQSRRRKSGWQSDSCQDRSARCRPGLGGESLRVAEQRSFR